MNMLSTPPAPAEARAAVASTPDTSGVSILTAATLLLPQLERGTRIDATILRAAMESAFFDTDAAGRWDWKTAYDAGEAATDKGPGKFIVGFNAAVDDGIDLRGILSNHFAGQVTMQERCR